MNDESCCAQSQRMMEKKVAIHCRVPDYHELRWRSCAELVHTRACSCARRTVGRSFSERAFWSARGHSWTWAVGTRQSMRMSRVQQRSAAGCSLLQLQAASLAASGAQQLCAWQLTVQAVGKLLEDVAVGGRQPPLFEKHCPLADLPAHEKVFAWSSCRVSPGKPATRARCPLASAGWMSAVVCSRFGGWRCK